MKQIKMNQGFNEFPSFSEIEFYTLRVISPYYNRQSKQFKYSKLTYQNGLFLD